MLLFEDHLSGSVDHKAIITAIAFSPDGATLTTGAKDGTIFIRNMSGSISSFGDREAKNNAIHAIGFLPGDGGVLIGGAAGWSRWNRDGDDWQPVGPLVPRPVTSLGVLNESTVAFGIGDRSKPTSGSLEIWDIARHRKLLPYFQEPNGVRVVAACPAKKLVAWATHHRKVRLWDITSPKPIDFPQPGVCPAVALSEDGKALAVAVDWTIKLYDVERRHERLVMKGHKGQVATVAFSPDGRTLVTGSWDMTVRLWDVASGQEQANLNCEIGRVLCVAYAPDGLRLAAGGDLGRVVVWDAE